MVELRWRESPVVAYGELRIERVLEFRQRMEGPGSRPWTDWTVVPTVRDAGDEDA